jgi:hypothetical protein
MNYNDPSFKLTYELRRRMLVLNAYVSHYHYLSTTRPSKQSRKEAHSRMTYLTKQRNALLNLYPEYFL